MSVGPAAQTQTLHCMEIWGGIEPVESRVQTPGLDLWVFSRPFEGDEQGGDVHFVTLCGGGILTRIVVADVSGHGSSVAEFSSMLRSLLRKHINHKSQTRLVEQLNREFAGMARLRRFATAVVATYLTSTDELSISNAGHPRPLHYRAADGTWSLLIPEAADPGRLANLPLGLDDETYYGTARVQLGRGDLVVVYTDALIEAADGAGQLLGESGLLEAARRLDGSGGTPAAIGQSLLDSVARHREGRPADDDVTVVVLHHNASHSPRLGLGQKLDVYAKVFGLKPV
jgi:sigma-B regulation protein RsbU (phosphoserine phosphatase)